jgi:predicted metal-dependent hydrolase
MELIQIDQLFRSKRKSVALIVESDGRLIVRAPQHLSLAQIQSLVDSKAAWVQQKRAQIKDVRARNATPTPRRYVAGEAFSFLGEQYPLAIVPGERPRLSLSGGKFLLTQAALPQAEQIFTAWYREQARRICSQHAAELARKMGLSFARIRISSARTRWGSCSSRGTLSFTWRLVLAPIEIVDYVVVHELAHLREPNHSPRFWAIVEKFMPDYKRRRDWLKKNAKNLGN